MISSCLYRKSNWHYQECQFWRVGRFCGTHGYPILRQALLGIDPYQSGEEVVFEAKTIPVLDLSPKNNCDWRCPILWTNTNEKHAILFAISKALVKKGSKNESP